MPCLVGEDGELIAGHGRVLAATQLGLTEAPVIVLGHLTEAQRRAYRIADNKLTELGSWDEALLSAELQDLLADNYDLSLVGFSDGELDKLLAFDPDGGGEEEGGAGGSVPPVTIPEPPRNPASRTAEPTAVRTDLGAIFVSLELSRSSWVVTALAPGSGERMSRHGIPGGDIAGLLARFAQLRDKAQARTGRHFPIIVIQEAGLDGFWIHRALVNEGVESHVVDPASIATSRRRRRAKTDRLDGETLVRTLLAFKRGEPRVCAMVRAPSPEDEDRRRITRERKVLIAERVEHVNRIKGLLFAQGIRGYEPLRRDRRARLEDLRTGDGRDLPPHLKAQILRELDRLELLLEQIKAVEAERDAALAEEPQDGETPAAAKMLLDIRGMRPGHPTR